MTRNTLRLALLLLTIPTPHARAQDLPDTDEAADARASFAAGSKSLAEGRFEEAADSYRAAARLEPTSAAAHNGLCVAYAKLRRLAEALGACREAVRHVPEDGVAHQNLGRVFDETGRNEGASRRWSGPRACAPTRPRFTTTSASRSTTAASSARPSPRRRAPPS